MKRESRVFNDNTIQASLRATIFGVVPEWVCFRCLMGLVKRISLDWYRSVLLNIAIHEAHAQITGNPKSPRAKISIGPSGEMFG